MKGSKWQMADAIANSSSNNDDTQEVEKEGKKVCQQTFRELIMPSWIIYFRKIKRNKSIKPYEVHYKF